MVGNTTLPLIPRAFAVLNLVLLMRLSFSGYSLQLVNINRSPSRSWLWRIQRVQHLRHRRLQHLDRRIPLSEFGMKLLIDVVDRPDLPLSIVQLGAQGVDGARLLRDAGLGVRAFEKQSTGGLFVVHAASGTRRVIAVVRALNRPKVDAGHAERMPCQMGQWTVDQSLRSSYRR